MLIGFEFNDLLVGKSNSSGNKFYRIFLTSIIQGKFGDNRSLPSLKNENGAAQLKFCY